MMAGWTPRPDDRRRPARLLRRARRTSRTSPGSTSRTTGSRSRSACQRFKPLINDEYGGRLIAEIVGLVSMTLAEPQRAPHGEVHRRPRRHVDADPVLGARRRRVDVDASGPIRGGSTSLPPKTAKYTTTRGQAHPGRVQRRGAGVQLRRCTTCATTTTTPGSSTTPTTRRWGSWTRQPAASRRSRPAEDQPGARPAASSSARRRSSRRSALPVWVLGMASSSTTSRGALYTASPLRQCAMSSSGVASAPALRAT